MAYRKGGRGKKFFKRRNYRKRKVSRPNKSMVKQIKRILHQDVETKVATNEWPLTIYNSGISATGDMGKLVPNISQSTLENGRVGDQIRGQKLDIRGHIIMNVGYNIAADARIGVRVMILQPKNLLDYNSVFGGATWLSNILKRGSGTFAFTGIISDLYSDINTDAVTKYYDKTFIMTSPYIPSGATSTTQDLNKTTVKLFRKTINLRNKCLKYDVNVSGGIQPTAYSPTLLIGYAHLDGSAPDTLFTQLSAQWNSNLYYEDA